MYDQCLPQGSDAGFGKTLKSAVQKGIYENQFAGLMAAFLRRYTYAGDVLNRLNGKPELSEIALFIYMLPALTPRRPLEIKLETFSMEKRNFHSQSISNTYFSQMLIVGLLKQIVLDYSSYHWDRGVQVFL